jgi:hypothetical protein
MSESPMNLVHAYLDGELTDSQRVALTDWLRQDPQNVDQFVAECRLHSELLDACCDAQSGVTGGRPVSADDGLSLLSSAVAVPGSSALPPSPFSLGSFVLSYGVAAVILCIGILIGWVCHVSNEQPIANKRPGATALHPESEIPFVARVTGRVDCHWADPSPEVAESAYVPAGRKYALTSGLMEITYDSGAKVILEGPCVYQVESESRGYLHVGKLTAVVEKRGERGQRRGERGEKGDKSLAAAPTSKGNSSFIADPSSFTPHSSALPLPPSPLFSIRTPTAIITDLGTEFAVQVEKSGVTRSLVFRGSVKMQAVSADGKAQGSGQIMHRNDSARVDAAADGRKGGNPQIVPGGFVKPVDFVRKMPRQTIRTFDLVDAVAGGDGFSGRRNRGINSTNGRAIEEPIIHGSLESDGQYHRVKELPFVDGVFIPCGGADRVQVDSAGHTADLPKTARVTAGGLWVGGKDRTNLSPNPAALGGVDYSAPEHCVLFLHANQGITFDLAAIRRANPGCKLLRFRAMAGNSYMPSRLGEVFSADLWVLVDGRVRCQHREINGSNGAFAVSVPITDRDRFLTLVSTDAGNSIVRDWVMFGDPRLEFIATESPAASSSSRSQPARKEKTI